MSKRMLTDKTNETLRPYQPFGWPIPMMHLLLGIAGLCMLITAIYEYCF